MKILKDRFMFRFVETSVAGRCLFGLAGAVFALVEPTLPFIIICTLAVLGDSYTAWALNKRAARKYPTKADGKFRSERFGKVFGTLIKIYLLIILVYHIDNIIFEDLSVKLANIVAGAVCFWQIWSMLENEASCNNAKWAKFAQRILVDKTERHFNIDLHELKPGEIDMEKDNSINQNKKTES